MEYAHHYLHTPVHPPYTFSQGPHTVKLTPTTEDTGLVDLDMDHIVKYEIHRQTY